MKQKLVDTNQQISKGGRAYWWWLDKSVSKKGSGMVVGGLKDDEVNLQRILETYKLKGFEFGNWLSNDDRFDRVIAAESSLRDLASIIGTKNLGINHQIGLAFGARGVGGALAHYEPGANMINLTKEKGFGSLAHEYAHALDYNIGSFIDQNKKYAALSGGSSTARQLSDNTGAQFRWYVNKIVDAIKGTESYAKMSSGKQFRDDYWHRRTEIWARFFEQYICWKLKQKKLNNTFLCKSWTKYTTSAVYLSEKDFKTLVRISDAFCSDVAKLFSGKTKSLVTKPYPGKMAADKKEEIKVTKPRAKATKTTIVRKGKIIKQPKTASKAKVQKKVVNKQFTQEQVFKWFQPLVKLLKSYQFGRPIENAVLYEEDGSMIATNGHVLGVVDKSLFNAIPIKNKRIHFPDGGVIGTVKEYPKWRGIMPGEKDLKRKVMIKLPVLIKRLESDLKNYTNYKKNGGVKYIGHFKIGRQAFDLALLLRLSKFMKNFGDICYFEEAVKNQSAARVINDQGVICIIMPIKLDE